MSIDTADASTSPVLGCPHCDKPMPRIVTVKPAPSGPDRDRPDVAPYVWDDGTVTFDSWACPNKPCHFRAGKLRGPGASVAHPTEKVWGQHCLTVLLPNGSHRPNDPECDCVERALRVLA